MKSEVTLQVRRNRFRYLNEQINSSNQQIESPTQKEVLSNKARIFTFIYFKSVVIASAQILKILYAIPGWGFRKLKKEILKINNPLKNIGIEIKEQLTLFAAFFFGDEELINEILNVRENRRKEKSKEKNNQPGFASKSGLTGFLNIFSFPEKFNWKQSLHPAVIYTGRKLRSASTIVRTWLL